MRRHNKLTMRSNFMTNRSAAEIKNSKLTTHQQESGIQEQNRKFRSECRKLLYHLQLVEFCSSTSSRQELPRQGDLECASCGLCSRCDGLMKYHTHNLRAGRNAGWIEKYLSSLHAGQTIEGNIDDRRPKNGTEIHKLQVLAFLTVAGLV